ncbi:MAG: filamentous hemagglutinin N-terminal domain-containing protein, partial [Alphaproteobacteria bacterium]|nr:filamentous hemagglutinin N-terminal domain-containing protein [Alphaproteobacteria bacterium]
MQKTYHHKLLQTTVLCGLIAAPGLALANPQDGTVVGGSASIAQVGSTLTVNQTSDKAIIDWRSFDIAHGETTQFNQPSSSSIALNRIRDNKPSQISGQLNANGRVILVNPKGVVFNGTAQVNVNGLVVSSSDIDNDRFMNNQSLRFDVPGDADAQIINSGTITVASAGLVGLVAPNVSNQGTITATLGKVQLASGDAFTLDFAGDGISQVIVTGDLQQQLIENSGLIAAQGGRIELSAAAARSAVDALVVNTGELKADSFAQQGGMIRLFAGQGKVKNSGTIGARGTNSGEQGGSIEIAADDVEHTGTMDASGDIGGEINVAFSGVYYDDESSIVTTSAVQGKGGTIRIVATHDDASIETKGTYSSESEISQGGDIVFFADHVALRNNSRLSVKGRTGGTIRIGLDPVTNTRRGRDTLIESGSTLIAEGTNGNGGSIEIASDNIDMRGTADARGLMNGGSINIDAAILYYSSPTALLNVSGTEGAGGDIIVDAGDTGSIYASGAYISDGATTGGNIDMLAGQDISLIGALLNVNGNQGGGNVRIGGEYQGTGTTRRARNTSLDEDTIILANATVDGDGGRVIVWSDDTTDFGGHIEAKGANGGSGGFVETSGHHTLNLNGGSVIIGKGGKWLLDPTDVTIDAAYAATIKGTLDGNGDVEVNTNGSGGSGDITLSSAITTTGSGSLTLTAARNITLNASITLAGGDLLLQADNDGNSTGYVATAGITTAGGDVTIGGGSGTISAGSGYAVGNSSSGTQYGVNVRGSISAGGGSIIINGQGGAYSSGNNSRNYGVYLNANGASSASMTTSGTGTVSIYGTGGSAGNNNFGIGATSSYGDNGNYATYNITSTGSGAITLSGTAGSGSSNYGIYLVTHHDTYSRLGYNGSSTYSGAITISATGAGMYSTYRYIQTTDSAIDLTGLANITGSASTQNPYTTHLYTTNGAITLNATTGNTGLGNVVTTNAAITLTNSAGSIQTSTVSTSSSGSAPVTITAAGNILVGYLSSNVSFNSSSITGSSITLKSRSGDGGTGYVYTGSLTTGGGDVTIGGGSGAISGGSGFAIGTGTQYQHYGVY